eukprot:CAMPEP_0197911330 /NCGR_PEP_ID=MMETSP1439-20131203/72641_1 /TAXON_ID=66791 /ORGANISM="Gonyaulax spinifera, Strain CCMP409" /LENGTH=297 /DNA_ID=CAMNT_0043533057 /DNA_START=63 /DNA_END=956 /DNA_ORIENTATION=-
MGGKKKEKEEDKPSDASKSGSKQQKGKAAQQKPAPEPTAAFRMPEPERTLQVSSPAILPPALLQEDGDGGAEPSPEDLAAAAEMEAMGALPKKLQLSQCALLKHPVTISAIDNFMTEEECHTWISWGERRGFDEAKQKQNTMYAFRDNGRIEFSSPDVAYQIWLRMRPFMPETVGKPCRKLIGCSPRIRVYRYTRGQRFGQHVDGSRDEPEMGGRTHFTVLVYLNGGDRDPGNRVKGGETVFWKDHDMRRPALAFPPTRGVCLFHGHGDECMTHEGAGVEDGAKYILRTDVVCEKDS